MSLQRSVSSMICVNSGRASLCERTSALTLIVVSGPLMRCATSAASCPMAARRSYCTVRSRCLSSSSWLSWARMAQSEDTTHKKSRRSQKASSGRPDEMR